MITNLEITHLKKQWYKINDVQYHKIIMTNFALYLLCYRLHDDVLHGI